jgi:hypothetical protein
MRARARVQLFVDAVTDPLVRDVDEAAGIFAIGPVLSSFTLSGMKRGPHSADPCRTCVFFVAGTGFEPVTSGL